MPLSIQQNISLKALNTFGIQSVAREYVEIRSAEEFGQLAQSQNLSQKKHVIVGGGSNILLPELYEGLVIHNAIKGFEIMKETEHELLLKAGGGELWHDLVQKSLELNLGGLENLSLIPGTVGAAPLQNIGAYGVEMKDGFESLEAIELSTGALRTFGLEECQFGYRSSVFKQALKGQYFIASVTFALSKNPIVNPSYGAIEEHLSVQGIHKPTIHEVSRAVIAIRKSKLPDPQLIPNAGSFFKNPILSQAQFKLLQSRFPDAPHYPAAPDRIKVPAAWLIEQCGWKGYRNEVCGVHEKQALVLINHGGATASDLLALAQQIAASVMEKCGVSLDREVNVIE